MNFILLHIVNTLVLMPTLVEHQWISRENAVRLIEWAGRLHLLHYVAETAPQLSAAELDTYPSVRSWDQVFDLAKHHPSDDGHLVKSIRALAWGEQVMSKKYDQAKNIMEPGTWLKLANLGESRL
jgi:Questin oxidase-like